MALSPGRILEGGETEFPWERDAIDYVMAGAEPAGFADGARVLRDDFAPVDQLISGP